MMRRRVEADENGATSSIPADHREYPNGRLNADFGKAPKTFSSLNEASSTLQTLTIVASFVLLGVAIGWATFWTPQPLPYDAPVDVFSEGRAMATVRKLSEDIGVRLVGTPELDEAAHYLIERAHELKRLAERDRPDLLVEVDVEEVSGALNLMFMGTPITNAYRNLTNILLRVAPKRALGQPAVLINAHYDTSFGSPGASDCAGCVGVALEVARMAVASKSMQLPVPLMLLLNGGEETVLTAAHGFMQSSKWADQVGVFINLESTGPGGPDVLFQHTGAWTLEAYGRGAKYPHGSVFAQDFFETRLLSMDTDFRVLSATHQGKLPGIDIAQVFDGAAYHTHLDNVQRLRKGTLQMLGENVVGTMLEMGRQIRGQASQPLPAGDAEGSVFLDILGAKMVRYPMRTGRWVHALALPVALLAVVLLPRRKGGAGRWAASGRGLALWAASTLAAIAVPAALGALRVLLTGRPIAWFGRPVLAYAMYLPAALAGVLLPYAFGRRPPNQAAGIHGAALAHAALAALMSLFGLKSSFAFALWAVAGSAGLICPKEVSAKTKLLWTLVTSVPALLSVATFGTLPIFVMEHISLSGKGAGPLRSAAADVAVGCLFGLAATIMIGHLRAVLAQAVWRHIWQCITGLLLVSTLCAAALSHPPHPYTAQFSKRILLQHLLRFNNASQDCRWVVGTLDVIPVEVALPQELPGPDQPIDWQALYPIGKVTQGVAFAAPMPDLAAFRTEGMRIEMLRAVALPGSKGLTRLHMELRLPCPVWGAMNVTGPVKAWSLAAEPPEGFENGARVARISGNEGMQMWPLWMDVEGEWQGKLRIELSVMRHEQTPAIEDFRAKLPEWTTCAAFTVFQKTFQF